MRKYARTILLVLLGSSLGLNLYFLGFMGYLGSKGSMGPNGAADTTDLTAATDPNAAIDPNGTNGANGTRDPRDPKDAKSPEALEVVAFGYNGAKTITLGLNVEPDMDVLSEYITAGPLEKGRLSFTKSQWYDYNTREYRPLLRITGDFMHRTNLTLRVRAGFPASGGLVLKDDYVRKFKRNDEEPEVGFSDSGRYLPPMGARAIAIRSVNAPTVRVQLRKVPSANIVAMLALEEGAYDSIYASLWKGESAFVRDLSSEMVESYLPTANRLNTEEKTYFPLGSTNGVYLVSLTCGDKDPGESRYDRNPPRHRVVAMSDLGLSVRKTPNGLLVWTTSISKGVPVPGAKVELYSSANILLDSDVADASGLAAFTDFKGKPFAVVVSLPDGSDLSFMALRPSMSVAEDVEDMSGRGEYLKDDEVTAFLWTDRGIYRHGERIFVHAILRNGLGSAPKPFPLELRLIHPNGIIFERKTLFPDASGALSHEGFAVGASQPSGNWRVEIATPGNTGFILGSKTLKIEEFAPPTIRVKVLPRENAAPKDFAFTVAAEHLYGGPAKSLRCDGAILFEDEPFAPKGWKGWSFGSEDRGLKPAFRELAKGVLGEDGKHEFPAELWTDYGKPKAAIKVTAQGTVFEDGGRPATARASAVIHAYPFYIGATLDSWVKKPESGRAKVSVACVKPDGTRLAEGRGLVATLEQVESVYSYREDDRGFMTWDCDRIRTPLAENLPIGIQADSNAVFEIPAEECGDYVLTISDKESGAQFSKSFYLSDWGDPSVRAPLANPTKVALASDKPFYRPGDEPKLVIKSPFAGTALLTVLRDSLVYSEVLSLTNATSEVVLPACTVEWAPNVDVYISILHEIGGEGLAARAHGGITLAVRPAEREIPVELEAEAADGLAKVAISAPGGEFAVVTLVDEAINILTDEPEPDPMGYFAKPRRRNFEFDAFYDLYSRILPVFGEDKLKANGVKTGGGCDVGLLGRVSPVPTRRFKPLSLWEKEVPLKDGKAEVSFAIPEFTGEARITAVAYSAKATGSASLRKKVCPKLVIEPDAPRFVAPGDIFRVTLPVANKSEKADEIAYRVSDGAKSLASGTIRLEAGESRVLKLEAVAQAVPGQMNLVYTAMGCGEKHEKTIELPVRPAMAWRATAGVEYLESGAKLTLPAEPSKTGVPRLKYKVSGSPAAELESAYSWLANYPHGCLEQTASQMFPLLYVAGKEDYVAAGAARVASMVRANDFTMWPDCNYAPWDAEVSLYAAHFLVEASRRGVKVPAKALSKVEREFLPKWAMSTNSSVSAYACHTLALAGRPEKDRMLRLYDAKESLSLLSRSRLARAFVATGDLKRAEALLANAASPSTVKEAAFALLAILETDPSDSRLPRLVLALQERRSKELFSWGTTEENAHALLALGAWYRAHPMKEGEPKIMARGRELENVGEIPAYISWEMLDIPPVTEDRDESTAISLRREYFTAGGEKYDMSKACVGDLVIVRLTLTSEDDRWLNDLVFEDLFPGAFEPVLNWEGFTVGKLAKGEDDWVMRWDARDDRMLVFSKRFYMDRNRSVKFEYPVRIVSSGEYALPGASVEAMYSPELRARVKGSTIKVGE